MFKSLSVKSIAAIGALSGFVKMPMAFIRNRKQRDTKGVKKPKSDKKYFRLKTKANMIATAKNSAPVSFESREKNKSRLTQIRSLIDLAFVSRYNAKIPKRKNNGYCVFEIQKTASLLIG